MATETVTALPYVAFSAFDTFLKQLKALPGIPDHVDKDMMEGMSGATRAHLYPALRSLDLIGDQGKSTPKLSVLVEAYGTPKWNETLAAFTKETYADSIGTLNIETASRARLDACFKDQPQSTRKRAVRFYLNCLKEAGVTFSPLFTKRRERSKSNGASTKRRPSSSTRDTNSRENSDPPDAEGTVRYPLFFRGKPEGSLVVPEELSAADCRVIELQLAVLRAYAGDESEYPLGRRE